MTSQCPSSLTLLLPVQNAQAILAKQLSHILDVLSDLTPRFQIVIVVNGSSDHTEDIAHEMAAEYPQISVVAHHEPCDEATAFQSALTVATGDVIVLYSSLSSLRSGELRRLLGADGRGVRSRRFTNVVQQLRHWGAALQETAWIPHAVSTTTNSEENFIEPPHDIHEKETFKVIPRRVRRPEAQGAAKSTT